MYVVAHIGKIPVEEWVPFLVPLLALFLFGRRRDRRRAAAVSRLPEAGVALDDRLVRLVTERWGQAGYRGLSAAHLPVLYPPGPDGMTAGELAARIEADPLAVRALLDDLDALGYVDVEGDEASPRAWLTLEGHNLFYATEEAVLAGSAELTR